MARRLLLFAAAAAAALLLCSPVAQAQLRLIPSSQPSLQQFDQQQAAAAAAAAAAGTPTKTAVVTRPRATPSATFGSFAECLAGMPNYSIMRRFGDRLGLTQQYADPSLAWTIFAPTDAAFTSALAKVGLKVESLDKVPVAVVKGMLTPFINYHIVPQLASTVSLYNGQVLSTKNPEAKPLVVSKAPGDIRLQPAVGSSARIVRPNVRCGAGWAHGIDGLLMPKELPKLPPALMARLG